MHSFANMYGAFDVVLYFVIIQLFWLLINLLLISFILSYLIKVKKPVDCCECEFHVYIIQLFRFPANMFIAEYVIGYKAI